MEELKDERIEKLLGEFDEQRNHLKEMVRNLEDLKTKIDRLFPQAIETRYIRFFEEKVKSATALFSAILEVRKEIIRTLKEEVELRNKYQKRSEEEIFSEEEIRALALRVERITKRKETIPLMEKMERNLLPDSNIKSPEFTTVTEGYNPDDKEQGEKHA